MTEIYLHTVARMADYIHTHPYAGRTAMTRRRARKRVNKTDGDSINYQLNELGSL